MEYLSGYGDVDRFPIGSVARRPFLFTNAVGRSRPASRLIAYLLHRLDFRHWAQITAHLNNVI